MAPCSNDDSTRITYNNKADLKTACLKEARRQFTQAATTPMLQQPMIKLVGFADMDKPAFQQILDGNFKCPDTCDLYLRKLLPYLCKPEHIPAMDMQTYTEYK